jgi:hypothetical protein
MTSILALSVTDKIEQYGAYAGFASVLGLAVLSLLYFAQAREVKRLREWAGRSPERAAELQERAVAAAQQRAIAQPQRPAGAQPQPGTPGAPGQPRPAAATPAGQAAAGAGGAGSAAAAAATAAGAAGTATQAAPGAAAPGAPGQPTTAIPAANGAAAGATATPPPARPGQPLRVPPNGPAGSTAARLQEPDDDEPRSRTGLLAAIGAILVVAIVGVVLVTGVLGGDDDSGTQPPSTVATPNGSSGSGSGAKTKTTPGKATPSSTPKPGTYTVAVLNGTTVPGLARGVANRLQENKYKIGNVTNAATQDRSATLVEYAQGHRAEADQVAKAIDVGNDSITTLTDGSKTIAGDAATVVVTVGADQNVSPQSNGTATGTTG